MSSTKTAVIFAVLLSLFCVKAPCAVAGEDASREISVDGIAYSGPGSSMAIINGEMVPEGGTVGGYTIKKIDPDRVTLSDGSRTLILGVEEGGGGPGPAPEAGVPRAEKIKEAVRQREAAEKEMQKIKDRRDDAQKVIAEKEKIGRKIYPSMYGEEWKEYEPDLTTKGDGEIFGHVYVWGYEPLGSVGNCEGIEVLLNGKDGSFYRAYVDEKNEYHITAPSGRYTLVIDEPGYKRYEKEVYIEAGRQNFESPIGLQNKK